MSLQSRFSLPFLWCHSLSTEEALEEEVGRL